MTINSAESASRRRWIALVVVCLSQLMIVVDMTIVNVALPSIQHDLQFSQADLTWVVNAYLIAYGSFLLMAGRLGDLVGRKRMFLSGVVLFTAASAVCGLVDGRIPLIAARFVQGVGGAVAASAILALIVTDFPRPDERVKAMSAYMFVVTAGGSLGLLAGGSLVQSVDWHWIFFVNVPIGAAVLALGAVLIDEREGIGLRNGVDILGSVLVTTATMLAVYAIVTSAEHGWGSAHTLGFGAAALALLAIFAWWEARIANPILPLRILRLRSLVGASAVRAFMATGMFTSFFLGTLYLQRVLGYDAWETGLAFLPMTLTVAGLSLGTTARLVRRFGAERTMLAGLVSTIAGLAVLTRAGQHAPYAPALLGAFVLIGLGAATAMMPLLTIATSEVPPRDAGLASGIVNVTMQIGAALGLAVLGTLATDRADSLAGAGASVPGALTGGYHLAFAVAAACVAAGILLALAVLRAPGGRRLEPELAEAAA